VRLLRACVRFHGVTQSPEREQLWNLPNSITIGRLIVLPVLAAFPWLPGGRDDPGDLASIVVGWLFVLSTAGDLADGWIARRRGIVTSIGKHLDPLADKLTTATALIVLLAMDRIPPEGALAVAVIVGRELAVTGLRSFASERGGVMAAAWPGKLKTVFQNVATGFLLFPEGTLGLPNHPIGMSLLVVATALTLWSGWGYFAAFFGHASDPPKSNGLSGES
jgi:CDP-diacylglycerol--glycerol-3-phosphate 3-phosphatidyltransferase